MKQALKELLKHLALYLAGGCIYIVMELGFRGHSHWSMFLVGGLCFLLIGGINNWISWKMPIWLQGLIGDAVIVAIELLSGYILNIRMGLGVWDYSNLPMNFLGQICLPFAILWFPVAVFGIIIDDYLRYWFFQEEKPQYYLWFK